MDNNNEKKIDEVIKRKEKAKKTREKRMSKCVGKVSHSSKSNAELARQKHLDKAKAAGNPIVSRLNVYKCNKCHKWHVGANRREILWNLIPGLK